MLHCQMKYDFKNILKKKTKAIIQSIKKVN